MDDPSLLSWVFRLAVATGAIVLIYFALFSRRAEFVIDVRKGEVRHKGRVPLAVVQQLAPFLLHDMGITDSVRILGSWQGKRMRVWFRGQLSRGQQQRIRNFLANV